MFETNRKYTAFLKNKNVTLTSEELKNFSAFYLEDCPLKNRISELFWLDLYIYENEFGIFPKEIIDELKSLENGGERSFTKPPSMFSREPLKGLWHKHYFSAHFTPQNIMNELRGNGLSEIVDEELSPEKSDHITKDMINDLLYNALEKPLEERSERKKITGEWISYAIHNDENYYLCLCTHNAGDQNIFERIFDCGLKDFEFLKNQEPFASRA